MKHIALLNRRSRALLTAVWLAGALGGFWVPQAFADTPPTYYVALGDSIAWGYQPKSAKGDTVKSKETGGYAEVVLEALQREHPNLHLEKLACPGEQADTMITGSRPPREGCNPQEFKYKYGSQLADAVAFMEAHPGQIALVTIDIGGNDTLGCAFADFPAACLDAIDDELTANLGTILSELRDAAGPAVPIVGMTYYDPFLWVWPRLGLAQQARATVDFTVASNNVLEAAYAAAGSPVADVETAYAVTDFTTTADLPGVGPVPINVFNTCMLTGACTFNACTTWPCSVFDLHPNDAGYALIGRTFLDVLTHQTR
jgi:lysophospholipase L1-like esterase